MSRLSVGISGDCKKKNEIEGVSPTAQKNLWEKVLEIPGESFQIDILDIAEKKTKIKVKTDFCDNISP